LLLRFDRKTKANEQVVDLFTILSVEA